MEFQSLESNRLFYIELSDSHAGELFEIFSNRKVMKYYGMDPIQDVEQAYDLIHSFQQALTNDKGVRYGILFKNNNRLIGTIGLNNMSLWHKRAEIGYELHPEYWNRGIITEAIRCIVEYSFNELGLHRIGAVTFPQNQSSIRALTKLGFQEEGKLRDYLFQHNQSHDANVYSIIKQEWEDSIK
ncbi:GNAT family N-acetyltransferase [Pontibacillus salicampi]|uniref:GNAT family N-acetyltransferase n=1 Tax=Pontibacillus salicampi TaxID=1449801 RepID=A0ABV6LKQ8_9BACI